MNFNKIIFPAPLKDKNLDNFLLNSEKLVYVPKKNDK
jgi:hypothetical protein